MVNTRRNNQGGKDLPPPPPITMEQLMMMQTQLLQQMAQNMQNMGNGNGKAPPQVRDKRGDFLKGHPPVFKHSTDPLQANDWLRAIEGNLRLHSVMTRRRFCMLLDSYRRLHLIGGTLSALSIPKLIASHGQSFVVPSALIMCLLG